MNTMWKTLTGLLFAVTLITPNAAWAQDEEDDFDLDDILGEEEEKEKSVKEEKDELLAGDVDDRVGVKDKDVVTSAEEERGKRTRRIIKSLPAKTFMKIGRFEAAPQIGFVTNDPYINRLLIGVSLTYHPTEIFGIELQGMFSPDLGERDWKPVTKQLITNNQVSPDFSRIMGGGSINMQFSPIYGKVAIGNAIGNFDIYGLFGVGVINTKEDLEALGLTDPESQATAAQTHPSTNIGGGIRMLFGQTFAVRLEGRSMLYIETVSGSVLEMKGTFAMFGSFAIFFGGKK